MLDPTRRQKCSACERCCSLAAEIRLLGVLKAQLESDVTMQMIACELLADHSVSVASDSDKLMRDNNKNRKRRLCGASTKRKPF